MAACLACGLATALSDSPESLPEVAVRATPFATAALTTPATEVCLGETELSRPPQRTLDGILRDVPGFRLFRRTDSIAAHPTTQGVSLGNVGPSGASRTTVLWDGVPMNDPFGGWVPWTRFAPSAISAVRLSPQGGVSPWGTGSVGGVIAIDSRFLNDAPFAFVEGAAGNVMPHQATAAFAEDFASGTRLFGTVQESNFSGYPVIREDKRGPVDSRANSRERAFDAGVAQFLTADREWRLTLRASAWEEERSNGTALTRNSGEALDFSIRLTRSAGADEWSSETIFYTQNRQFESIFTSISGDRSGETPSLDQYAVPSSAAGLIHRTLVPLGDGHILGAGLDWSGVEGSTHERFSYSGAAFTKEREAGGRQSEGGVFLQDTWTPSKRWQIHGGVRLEVHQDSEGRLQEKDIATGAALKDRDYPRHTSPHPQLSLGAKWDASKRIEWSANVFSGGRNPTLNELYRPFRTGGLVTLANPELSRESVLGGETALKLKVTDDVTLRLKIFANAVRDAIATVSVARGPGTFGDWGYLPPGGVGAQRANVEKVILQGGEAGAEWRVTRKITFQASWQATHSEIERCSKERSLEGKRLAQVPSSQAVLQLRGDFQDWIWVAGCRHVAAQFDDDANSLSLAAYTTFDARITRRINTKTEVFVAGENLSNAEIQTRRDATGTVSIGAPRMWSAGLRREF